MCPFWGDLSWFTYITCWFSIYSYVQQPEGKQFVEEFCRWGHYDLGTWHDGLLVGNCVCAYNIYIYIYIHDMIYTYISSYYMHSYTIYTYIYIHIQMQIYSHQLPILHTSTHQEIWIQTLVRFYLHQNLVTSQPQVVLISDFCFEKRRFYSVIPPLMLLKISEKQSLVSNRFHHVSCFMFHGSPFQITCSVGPPPGAPCLAHASAPIPGCHRDFFRYLAVS